jgi:adenylate cyclase
MTIDASDAARGAPRAGRRWRFSLRFSVLAVVLATVALTAAAVHVPWLLASRDNTADMARQLNREILGGVSREVARLLGDAVQAQAAILDMVKEGVVDLDDRPKRDDFMFSFIKTNPHFSWVSFGYRNGDFIGVQRRDQRHYRVVHSLWDPERNVTIRTEDSYVSDDYGRYINTETRTRPSDYVSFQRQWYERAVATPHHHIWSDVYVFANSGQPGLNTAITYHRDGKLVGVVSVAIELTRVADYLRSLPVAQTGKAFIIDRQGQMIAFEDVRQVVERSVSIEERSRLRKLDDATAPLLRIAADAITARSVSLKDLKEPNYIRIVGPRGEAFFVSLSPTDFQDWIVGSVVPESDFTARIDDTTRWLVLALVITLILVAFLAIAVSQRLLVRPLSRMTQETAAIEHFEMEKVHYQPSPVTEIDTLSRALERMTHGLQTFGRYMSTDVVRAMLESGVEAAPGGRRRTLTVMFTDLEGFTTLTERLGHRIVPTLNAYLGEMTEAVVRHGGMVDKYIGDSVMAFWGAPAQNEEHALAACRAALDCAATMERFVRESPDPNASKLKIRISINTGRVIVGNIGSTRKLEYTVIGDPVNLANRIEGLNKTYGTTVLMGQATWEEVKYDVVARRIGSMAVRGREDPVTVYELLALNEDGAQDGQWEWVAVYERAIDAYDRGDWRQALDGFREARLRRGSDGPSEVMMARCEAKLAVAAASLPRIGQATERSDAP